MSVTITLDDELAHRLESQARARQVSLEDWALTVLGRAPEFPDQPDAWRELNVRRFALIHRKCEIGLDRSEEAELTELQATADRWLEPVDRQRLALIEQLEAAAEQLSDQSDE